VRTPRARPISTARFGWSPSSRPTATSSGSPQLGQPLPLQLLELLDRPGLDQLLEAPLDARADAAQLPHAAGADELGDRRRGRADEVSGAPVGPRAVETGARELEQRGERLEPAGDRRVVDLLHAPIVSPAR
jgi:hypothetical protein